MSRLSIEQLERDMPSVHLADRGVVRVSGEDAKSFLDGLVTCDLDRVSPQAARLGALLSPQGKILFDFIVFQAPQEIGGGYYLDTFKVFASDLAKRLTFYKLRAKVRIDDLSEAMAVVAGWDGLQPDDEVGLVTQDPRLAELGWRAIIAVGDVSEFAKSPAETYPAHRIGLGVPEGGRDFLFGDAFPHEALMDQLQGVDFDKGCYVGQEVVSRMQHRGTARTRLVSALYEGGFAADVGVEVTAGDKTLGKTGTGTQGRGLVMIRLDRAADALASHVPILAGGIPVKLEKPQWVNFPYPGENDTQSATEPA
jgi:tRNA-modifying protein YgfZ